MRIHNKEQIHLYVRYIHVHTKPDNTPLHIYDVCRYTQLHIHTVDIYTVYIHIAYGVGVCLDMASTMASALEVRCTTPITCPFTTSLTPPPSPPAAAPLNPSTHMSASVSAALAHVLTLSTSNLTILPVISFSFSAAATRAMASTQRRSESAPSPSMLAQSPAACAATGGRLVWPEEAMDFIVDVALRVAESVTVSAAHASLARLVPTVVEYGESVAAQRVGYPVPAHHVRTNSLVVVVVVVASSLADDGDGRDAVARRRRQNGTSNERIRAIVGCARVGVVYVFFFRAVAYVERWIL
uniref:Uncharacterized protein n=1 Tax=Leersia perrieri TaxID=77586 RepID=A0A0D9XLD0_9ORYZ